MTGSVILSVGAVAFDRDAPENPLLGADFYERLDVQSQLDAGATVDGDTIAWWFRQSDATRDAALERPADPGVVLGGLAIWMAEVRGGSNDGSVLVWGNGATFDVTLLEGLFNLYGVPVPWRFYEARDVRTVMDLAGVRKEDLGVENPLAHDALEDAKYQARYLTRALALLKRRP